MCNVMEGMLKVNANKETPVLNRRLTRRATGNGFDRGWHERPTPNHDLGGQRSDARVRNDPVDTFLDAVFHWRRIKWWRRSWIGAVLYLVFLCAISVTPLSRATELLPFFLSLPPPQKNNHKSILLLFPLLVLCCLSFVSVAMVYMCNY